MKVLKKIGVLSVGQIAALFGIIAGIIAGLQYWLMGNKGITLPGMAPEVANILLSPWAILIMPIISGIIYFLAGIICAALYNLFAKWIGGIKLDI